ncbi:hypothetical protein BP6252_01335 [Coleophoma cylindrospora]|uniref:Uncharacterized protein n=1 Tax=Coleophoma cylindrospora TaxID=1849047 RepID=A0A3D8SSK0_9HELO|nr:hypothetical protein BP6252_01335 [Coleophoma cylindrospora]
MPLCHIYPTKIAAAAAAAPELQGPYLSRGAEGDRTERADDAFSTSGNEAAFTCSCRALLAALAYAIALVAIISNPVRQHWRVS